MIWGLIILCLKKKELNILNVDVINFLKIFYRISYRIVLVGGVYIIVERLIKFCIVECLLD